MPINSPYRFFALCLALPAAAPLLAQTAPDSHIAEAGAVSRLSHGDAPGLMPEGDAAALYGQTITVQPERDGFIPSVLSMGAALLADERFFAGAEFDAGTPAGPHLGLSVGFNF